MIIVNNQKNIKPGIRALVIGVGRYDYAQNYNLNDITSATVSALAFALWLKHNLRFPNPSSEHIEYLDVEYLDVLVSPARSPKSSSPEEIKKTQQTYNSYRERLRQINTKWDYEDVNFTSIENAIDRWEKECNRSENEVAFFYFCGHGIEHKAITALLAQDFDARKTDKPKFEKSLDLRGFYEGTAGFQAINKYFFIDCCRETPRQIKQFSKIKPKSVVNSRDSLTHPGDAPLYLATKENESAFGNRNEISQFTDAIIRSLNGAGAKRGKGVFQGKWVVKSTTLTDGISEVLEFEQRHNQAIPQKPERGKDITGTVLHVLEDNPEIPAGFTWPKQLSSISFESIMNKTHKTWDSPPPKIIPNLSVPYPIDSWIVSATPDNQDFCLQPNEFSLFPPSIEISFELKSR